MQVLPMLSEIPPGIKLHLKNSYLGLMGIVEAILHLTSVPGAKYPQYPKSTYMPIISTVLERLPAMQVHRDWLTA